MVLLYHRFNNLYRLSSQYYSSNLFPFFYNLLAEGKLKDIQCKELRIDISDDFSRLLLTTKENTIGSITIEKDEI